MKPGTAEWQVLLQRLASNDKTLSTTLDLRCKSIQDSDIIALSEILRNNCTLTSLYLTQNRIGAEGAQYLSQALKHNITLTTLYLSNNNIGDLGAEYLASGLEVNCALTTLFLSSNNIGDQGAKCLSSALKKNFSLVNLHLGSNNIGEAGFKDFDQNLEDNHTLLYLCLDNNRGETASNCYSQINSRLTINRQFRDDLDTAIKNNNIIKVKEIISHSVNLLAQTGAKKLTPLQWAISYRNEEIINYLKETMHALGILKQANQYESPKALSSQIVPNKDVNFSDLKQQEAERENEKPIEVEAKEILQTPQLKHLENKLREDEEFNSEKDKSDQVKHRKFLAESKQRFLLVEKDQGDNERSEHPKILKEEYEKLQQEKQEIMQERARVEHEKIKIKKERQALELEKEKFTKKRAQIEAEEISLKDLIPAATRERKIEDNQELVKKLRALEVRSKKIAEKEEQLASREQELQIKKEELEKHKKELKNKERELHEKTIQTDEIITVLKNRFQHANQINRDAEKAIQHAKMRKLLAEKAEQEAREIQRRAQETLELVRKQIEITEKRGATPLFHAVLDNNYESVKKLLPLYDPNTRDQAGRTCLHHVISKANSKIAKLLLNGVEGKNVDPNIVDNRGQSALHIAAEQNNYKLIKLLLEHGAYSNQKDNEKRLPSVLLKKPGLLENKNYKKIKTLLEEAENKENLVEMEQCSQSQFSSKSTILIKPCADAWKLGKSWRIIPIPVLNSPAGLDKDEYGSYEYFIKQIIAALNNKDLKKAEEDYRIVLSDLSSLPHQLFSTFFDITHQLGRLHIDSAQNVNDIDVGFYSSVIKTLEKLSFLEKHPLNWVFFYLNAGDGFWQQGFERQALIYYSDALWYLEYKFKKEQINQDEQLQFICEQLYRRIDSIEAIGYYRRLQPKLFKPFESTNSEQELKALEKYFIKLNGLMDYLGVAEQWIIIEQAYKEVKTLFERYSLLLEQELHKNKQISLELFKNLAEKIIKFARQLCSYRCYEEAENLLKLVVYHATDKPGNHARHAAEYNKTTVYKELKLIGEYKNNQNLPPPPVVQITWRISREELLRYREELKQAIINPKSISILILQREYSKKIINLLSEKAKYCENWLDAPSEFNLIATGSLSRQVPSPFSDLDCAFLVEDEESVSHHFFEDYSELFTFTVNLFCDKAGFGFCIDSGDVTFFKMQRSTLINTSAGWLKQFDPQKLNINDESLLKIAYSLYHPTLIYRSQMSIDESLFKKYLSALAEQFEFSKFEITTQVNLDKLTYQRLALECLSYHYKEYRINCKYSKKDVQVNLKERYLQPLTFWCTDIAMFAGLQVMPILDILVGLKARAILDKSIIEVLEITLNYLHNLRIQIHFKAYGSLDVVKIISGENKTSYLDSKELSIIGQSQMLREIDEYLLERLYDFATKLPSAPLTQMVLEPSKLNKLKQSYSEYINNSYSFFNKTSGEVLSEQSERRSQEQRLTLFRQRLG